MREIRSYGSVGVPAGNRRHYPEKAFRNSQFNHRMVPFPYAPYFIILVFPSKPRIKVSAFCQSH